MKINDWLRAERLAHDVIFDLLNYAQGAPPVTSRPLPQAPLPAPHPPLPVSLPPCPPSITPPPETHTRVAPLGWIDWNLLVDFEGGPNHLGNLCDAPLVANENFTDVHVQVRPIYTLTRPLSSPYLAPI